jgi:hypothetical protein
MTIRTLRRTAERQLGLVTSAQLREHVSEQTARTAEARGWLVRVRRHVYRVAGSRPTWHQSVLAAVLAAGPGAAASHRTAAALWAMPGFPATSATPIEITVPRGRRPRVGGARLHTTLLGDDAVVQLDGVPVTRVARTLCDLEGTVPEAKLGRLVDEMLLRRRVTVEQLTATHVDLRRGSRRSRAMRRILADRGAEWAVADSEGEAYIARWLVDAGLPPPVQQHPVDGYRIDVAYPEHGVFIEYDGFASHTTRTRFESDRRRDNRLRLGHGAIVLRYTDRSTPEEVVRDVTAALGRPQPTPPAPPLPRTGV